MARNKRTLAVFGFAAGAGAVWLAKRAYQRARVACPPFHRQIYRDRQRLLRDLLFFWDHPEYLASLRDNDDLTRPMIGRLMLAVTGATGAASRIQAYRGFARRQGVSDTIAEQILAGDMSETPVDEAQLLFFATRYVEADGELDVQELDRLREQYGARTALDIVALVRLITMGHLIGNTFDALMSRVLGKPAPGSNLRSELAITLLSVFGVAPLMGFQFLRAMLLSERGVAA